MCLTARFNVSNVENIIFGLKLIFPIIIIIIIIICFFYVFGTDNPQWIIQTKCHELWKLYLCA